MHVDISFTQDISSHERCFPSSIQHCMCIVHDDLISLSHKMKLHEDRPLLNGIAQRSNLAKEKTHFFEVRNGNKAEERCATKRILLKLVENTRRKLVHGAKVSDRHIRSKRTSRRYTTVANLVHLWLRRTSLCICRTDEAKDVVANREVEYRCGYLTRGARLGSLCLESSLKNRAECRLILVVEQLVVWWLLHRSHSIVIFELLYFDCVSKQRRGT